MNLSEIDEPVTFDSDDPFPFETNGWVGEEWTESEIRLAAEGWDRHLAYVYPTSLLKLPGLSLGKSWSFVVVNLAKPKLVVNTRTKTREQALMLLIDYLEETPADSL